MACGGGAIVVLLLIWFQTFPEFVSEPPPGALIRLLQLLGCPSMDSGLKDLTNDA